MRCVRDFSLWTRHFDYYAYIHFPGGLPVSLKSLSLSLLVSIFSINSYAVVLTCHRKSDPKKADVGAFFMEQNRPTLKLESQLFDYNGWVALPVGTYKLDDIEDVSAVVSCRDGFEPSVQLTETKLESGLELNIGVICFDDPHVVTTNYELVCK